MSSGGKNFNKLPSWLCESVRWRKDLALKGGDYPGRPLAMTMFGRATIPRINAVKTAGTVQCWFADDAGAGGFLTRLHEW